MENKKNKVFDLTLFKRLLQYISPYRRVFIVSLICVIGLAVFGALRPYVLQKAIDEHVALNQYDGFLMYILLMLVLLILEVVSQLFFIYYANY